MIHFRPGLKTFYQRNPRQQAVEPDGGDEEALHLRALYINITVSVRIHQRVLIGNYNRADPGRTQASGVGLWWTVALSMSAKHHSRHCR